MSSLVHRDRTRALLAIMLAALVSAVSVVAGRDDPALTASFTAVPNPAACQQPVQFDAGGSSAGPDRQIVSYAWNFGDGTAANGVTVSHMFADFGSYSITLTVTAFPQRPRA